MVQGAHYILGPFGQDSDIRRWGLKLAERGGKNAKKRAVVAVARKLAVLLHKLWVADACAPSVQYCPSRLTASDLGLPRTQNHWTRCSGGLDAWNRFGT